MSDQLIKVTNRDNGFVGYQIPDMNISRNFAPRESKQIALSELKALQFVPGGEFTLRNLLVIDNRDALTALNMSDVEPEYHYTEDDVRKLVHEGSLDQLEDALNFAPEGVINLIKDIAVKEEVADMRKRQMIYDKTGFNVNNAINVNHIMADDSQSEVEDDAPKRKAAPINQPAETVTERVTRKASLPQYKVTTTIK